MKYAVEMGSGAVIYIRSFIKIASPIQKCVGVTQTAWRQRKPIKNKESMLKIQSMSGCSAR
jgi:hypothetical protein